MKIHEDLSAPHQSQQALRDGQGHPVYAWVPEDHICHHLSITKPDVHPMILTWSRAQQR